MSGEEVEAVYGTPPVMTNFKKSDQGFTDYFAFITFFDTAFILLFAAIHELVVKFAYSLVENKCTTEN